MTKCSNLKFQFFGLFMNWDQLWIWMFSVSIFLKLSLCILRLLIVLELLDISCNCRISFVLYIWTQFKLFLRYFSLKKFKLLFRLKETCLFSICVWKRLAYKKINFPVSNHLISTKVTLGKPFGAISSFCNGIFLTF